MCLFLICVFVNNQALNNNNIWKVEKIIWLASVQNKTKTPNRHCHSTQKKRTTNEKKNSTNNWELNNVEKVEKKELQQKMQWNDSKW